MLGTDSSEYSISNETSFESFYHMRDKNDSDMDDILDLAESVKNENDNNVKSS